MAKTLPGNVEVLASLLQDVPSIVPLVTTMSTNSNVSFDAEESRTLPARRFCRRAIKLAYE